MFSDPYIIIVELFQDLVAVVLKHYDDVHDMWKRHWLTMLMPSKRGEQRPAYMLD
jgi:hypothetical protein